MNSLLSRRAILVCAASLTCATASADEVLVVRIGHVGPISGAQAHYGKDNENGAGLALHAVDNLKLKTVAVIDDRTAYGQGVAEVFKNTARSKGMRIVDEQYTTDKATDFMAILTAIKARNPDAIFFGGMGPQAG